MTEALSHFNRLPLEMIFEIFYLLPIRDKKKARLVCHHWRMMIDGSRSVVFRPILTNYTAMEYFLESYRSMDKVILRNINKKMSKADFEFPRVKNAELGWKNSQGNIERFLTQGCEYAESVTLAKFSLERISRGAITKILSEINWKNLSQFKVVVTTSNYKDTRARKHLRNVTTMLKYVRIPALQELDFNFDFRYGFAKKDKLQYKKLFMGTYTFLVGHSNTLKILTGRINTTSQCTVEIPEIPMDMQQSLVFNMKLVQCCLSFCGVRRIESLINPTLLGTQLKILDIEFLKNLSSGGQRMDDLLNRIEHNVTNNLIQIYERNGKTLTDVSTNISSPTYLSKCMALKSFNWMNNGLTEFYSTFHGEDEDLNQLSHIQLKSFFARQLHESNLRPQLLQLLCQSVGTLEHLSLVRTHDVHLDEGRPIQFWLRECVGLKSLKIGYMYEEYIEANMGGQFPYLTELETYLNPQNRGLLGTWIIESMKNLKMIVIIGPHVDIEFLRTLFTLPKLNSIMFVDREGWGFLPPANVIKEMKEFCTIPGVTFSTVKDGSKIWHSGKMHVITIHHRSAAVNPISN